MKFNELIIIRSFGLFFFFFTFRFVFRFSSNISTIFEDDLKRRITRIFMQTLPTQRYRRQAVRNNLDIVGMHLDI